MIIFLPMNITANISIMVILNYLFWLWEYFRCSYFCYPLSNRIYVHISVTYSYTVSDSVKICINLMNTGKSCHILLVYK